VSTVLICILWCLVALLGLIILAPLHFEVEGEYAESLSFQGQVRWAGGLLSFAMVRREGTFQWSWSFIGVKMAATEKKGKTDKIEKASHRKKPDTQKGKGDSGGSISSYLNPQLFMAVKEVIFKLLRALHLRVNVSGTYGFDDPSLTGMTMGLMSALNSRKNTIDLTPDFTREIFDIRGSMAGWIIPLQILVIAIVFLLMKPVRAIWWPKIKFRKKQKEAVQYA
jgi:hypothetical protein